MKILPGLAACLLPLACAAEFVVPIDSVEEFVNVRMVPDEKSEIVGRLYRGDSAEVVKSMPEWHEIRIAGGATGFISADWTNLVDEVPPVALPVEKPTSAANTVAEDAKRIVSRLSPEEALSALANLEPVTFNYPQDEQERHVGFTAGNVPDLVAGSESEGLKPLEIVAVLTRVVKMQQHRIAELEARLGEQD